MRDLPKTLDRPRKPSGLSQKALWLSGEGAGSWFDFVMITSQKYQITRYSPLGEQECKSNFHCITSFDFNQPFGITYPSHCAIVTLVQDKQEISLERMLT